MRSAETSGADAEGFGVGKNAKDPGRVKASSPAKRRRFPQHISPITASIALTALLSAALFTICDSFMLVQSRLANPPSPWPTKGDSIKDAQCSFACSIN